MLWRMIRLRVISFKCAAFLFVVDLLSVVVVCMLVLVAVGATVNHLMVSLIIIFGSMSILHPEIFHGGLPFSDVHCNIEEWGRIYQLEVLFSEALTILNHDSLVWR